MTVTTENSITTALGDGITDTFSFNFNTIDISHVAGYVDGALDVTAVVVLNADQSVSPGGTVQFSSIPALNAAVSMVRDMDLQQNTNWPVGGEFPSSSHELAADKVIMIAQQTNSTTERSIRIPEPEDPAAIGTVLPAAASRANKFQRFDSLGNVAVSDSSSVDPNALQKPGVQGVEDNVILFNAADGETKDSGLIVTDVVTPTSSNTLENKVINGGALHIGTLVDMTASGTRYAEITGIPSWVKRIKLFVTKAGESVGGGNFRFNLGISTGYITANYDISYARFTNVANVIDGSIINAGFLFASNVGVGDEFSGVATISLIDSSDTWFCESQFGNVVDVTGAQQHFCVGEKNIGGALTSIQFDTGGNAWTSGLLKYVYEG